VLALRFLAALSDELVDHAEVGRYHGQALTDSRENRVSPFEHESIVLRAGDQDIARFDAKSPSQRRGDDEPSLRPDGDLDRLGICHFVLMCHKSVQHANFV
jgi:hypothetical protein